MTETLSARGLGLTRNALMHVRSLNDRQSRRLKQGEGMQPYDDREKGRSSMEAGYT